MQTSRTSNGLPVKRKADEDGKGSALKSSKTATAVSTTPASASASSDGANTSGNILQASRPYTGSARPSSSRTTRPLSERPVVSASKRPSLATAPKPSPISASFSGAARSTSVSSNAKHPIPPITTPSTSADAAKAPKKGSIAEIRARAAAQQAKLQGIGKIQHKSTEKQVPKKEREEAAAEDPRAAKKTLKTGVKSSAGISLWRSGSLGLQRNGSGGGHLDRGRRAIQKPEAGKPGKAPLPEERKVKKAALATTGYQGSARPIVGKQKPSAVRPGAQGAGLDLPHSRDKRPNPMGMFSKPRLQQDEDYDEDMDDFVVDDEEEEDDPGYGGRYRYADDDDDSDMEAGFSDVEDEESAAAKAARLEDLREERILEQKRREKAARRRGVSQTRR
ncbi:unnamed protein product [Discula destructiva]